MKLFELKADITFHAENLDDACIKLAEKFKDLDNDEIPETGYIKLGPINVEADDTYYTQAGI